MFIMDLGSFKQTRNNFFITQFSEIFCMCLIANTRKLTVVTNSNVYIVLPLQPNIGDK